jgi:hypothetical protein
MRKTEPLRLAAMGLLLIFLQLAWYLCFPTTRAALDLYPLFLLLATAAAGPLLGGCLALAGGVLMDLYGGGFGAFHCFYYLVPVALGSHLRAHMLTEFRLLGTLATVALILAKILAQLIWLLATNRLNSPAPLFGLNYWPLVLVAIAVYIFWPRLVSQFPMPTKVRSDGR